MNNIVIYESKYGSTEKYAKWIGEELNCSVSRIGDINIDELTNYDNIIFGGWVHAGSLKGFKKIYDNIDKLKDKNILVFAVGLATIEDKDYQEFKEKTFKYFNNLKHFYLRGAFDFNSLAFSDKMMMRIFKIILKRQKPENRDEKIQGMLNAYAKPVDFTDKECIKPIVEVVKKLNL